mgnify:CR=1 FL=1
MAVSGAECGVGDATVGKHGDGPCGTECGVRLDGAGLAPDVETLFNPPTFPLVPPGLIVSIAGLKGVSRSVRISAQWSGDSGLQVKQIIGLERREVE